MPACTLPALLDHARSGRYILGHFDVWNLESFLALVEAAEEENSPVILNFGSYLIDRQFINRQGGMEYFAALIRTAAERTSVPACLMFNEASTVDEIQRALDLGFNVVALETEHLPFDDNAALTRQVCELAHAKGAAVEGALGAVHGPPAEGAGPSVASGKTDPQLAAEFVAATGVDALAVGVDDAPHSIRGSYQSRLDLDLLARLGQAVDIPLVLHGGSGIPDEEIPAIVACGVHKINVGSVLKQAFLAVICRAILTGALAAGPHAAMGCQQPGDLMWEGKEAIKAVIRQKMGVYGSAGRGTMTNHE